MMKSNTLFCNLSFCGLHSISEGIGVIEIRIKHRYQLVVGTGRTQGAEMVAEDVVSPEVAGVFGVPVHVFHLPQLRQLYVSNVLARLNLGSTILKYVTPRTTAFVEEVVERSVGDGFWVVVKVDVWTVDREDGVDLSAYGWREMESEDEDDYGDGDGDGDEDEDRDGDEGGDRLAVDEGFNVGDDEDGNDSDGFTIMNIVDDGGDDVEGEPTVDEGAPCPVYSGLLQNKFQERFH